MTGRVALDQHTASIEALESMTASDGRARRKLALGLWAATRIGFSEDQRVLYALSVLEADRGTGDDARVLARVAADLAEAGLAAEDGELRARLAGAAPKP